MLDPHNEGRSTFHYRKRPKSEIVHYSYVKRYTQTAVASFGPRRQTECGHKPGGFTRLTPEVLDWVKTFTGMHHPGISSDPGES